MRILLRTDFRRLFHHPLFRIALLLHLLAGLFMFRNMSYRFGPRFEVSGNFMMLLFLTESLIVSLFICDQFSSGIYRNKLIVGYTKSEIYLSLLLVSLTTAAVLYLSYLPVQMLLGFKRLCYLLFRNLLVAACSILLLYLLIAALTVLMGTVSRHRILSSIACMFVLIMLLEATDRVNRTLSIPARIIYEVSASEDVSEVDFHSERKDGDEIIHLIYPKELGIHWNSEDIMVNRNGDPVRYDGNPLDDTFLQQNSGIKRINANQDYPGKKICTLLTAADLCNPMSVFAQSCKQFDYKPRYELSNTDFRPSHVGTPEDANNLLRHFPAQGIATVIFSALGMLLFRRKELS